MPLDKSLIKSIRRGDAKNVNVFMNTNKDAYPGERIYESTEVVIINAEVSQMMPCAALAVAYEKPGTFRPCHRPAITQRAGIWVCGMHRISKIIVYPADQV